MWFDAVRWCNDIDATHSLQLLVREFIEGNQNSNLLYYESLLTWHLMTINFQKNIFWTYVVNLYVGSTVLLEWWKSDEKLGFLGAEAMRYPKRC